MISKKMPLRPRRTLTPERIEHAALKLIEKDGLSAFSTRTLARMLGCEAMSIYHHFPSKAHLFDALVNRVVSELVVPSPTLPAFERIRRAAIEYRNLALRYPQFFPYLALHRMNTAPALQMLESILGIFHDAGFKAEAAARLFRVFSYYIVGAALDEISGYAKGPSAVEPVTDEEAARNFPLVSAAGRYFKPRHFQKTFETGLDILLNGMKKALPH